MDIHGLSTWIARAAGKPWTFALCTLAVLIWATTGANSWTAGAHPNPSNLKEHHRPDRLSQGHFLDLLSGNEKTHDLVVVYEVHDGSSSHAAFYGK